MNQPRINQIISHPASFGARSATEADVALTREQRQTLYGRYHKLGDLQARQVMLATQAACQQARKFRTEHEKANVEQLRLSPVEQVEYRRLAGKPGMLGEYIPWIASVATNALFELSETSVPQKSSRQRLSFETGGTSQGGIWQYTEMLDHVARSIPAQLSDLEVDTEVIIYERDDAAIKYKLEPLGDYMLHRGVFEYGLLRRRRMVADMRFNGMAPVHYFKEAASLIVMDQVSEGDRDKIFNACYVSEPKEVRKSNSEAALIAGGIFEAAIQASGNKPLDIVPIGAMYVASVTNSSDAEMM